MSGDTLTALAIAGIAVSAIIVLLILVRVGAPIRAIIREIRTAAPRRRLPDARSVSHVDPRRATADPRGEDSPDRHD